mmetsp:Transcript_35670/g.106452  ORF Transcript_35670/g.106452 Transcript_35670/m.106452 type:complete len:198 (-) Transcript_35670:635-1228(-)
MTLRKHNFRVCHPRGLSTTNSTDQHFRHERLLLPSIKLKIPRESACCLDKGAYPFAQICFHWYYVSVSVRLLYFSFFAACAAGLFALRPKALIRPTPMKKTTTCTCPFFFASMTPSLKGVLKKRWRQVAAKKADSIGEDSPLLIGSNPLFRGRNAPPQPPIVPQKIGPNKGNENRLGDILSADAHVISTTTYALKVS